MSHTTRCQSIFIEMVEWHSIDLLTEGLGLQHNHLLHPIPNTQQEIRVRTHTRYVVSGSAETDIWIWLFSSLSKDTIELEWWVFVYVDAWPATFLGDCEILTRGMNGERANTSSVLAEEYSSLLGEVVIDRVCDTRRVYDVISIENIHIVFFEAIESEALIQRSHLSCNKTILEFCFFVAVWIKEVIGDLS